MSESGSKGAGQSEQSGNSQEPVEEYYDPMAGAYHLLFEDWNETIRQDAAALDRLIQGAVGGMPELLLDCACGIGTQAIGLAQRGYRVDATDLSPAAVDRARQEADLRRVAIEFSVADIRSLESQIPKHYDLTLACDNALPHCLTDDELAIALRNLRRCLKPGGILMSSMRDYDRAVQTHDQFVDPHVYTDSAGRRLVFQVWDWEADGRHYEVRQFITRQQGSQWNTMCFTGQYRALLRGELGKALSDAGFIDIRWLLPEESGYYQPLVICRRG